MSASSSARSLLSEAKQALETFLSSQATFRVVKSVGPPHSTEPTSKTARTLFILDSSFNPPSVAHLALARNALTAASSSITAHYPAPHRLLLLFSTHNADKAPGPAPFEHRLAMMMLLAEHLARLGAAAPTQATSVAAEASSQAGQGGRPVPEPNDREAMTAASATSTSTSHGAAAPVPVHGMAPVFVDVGLTTKPFFNDKSTVIETSQTYLTAVGSNTPEKEHGDQQGAVHVHLVGFDTFTRILDPKYYRDFTPPLAALRPFFAKHRLRVKLRPEDAVPPTDKKAQQGWGSVDEQFALWQRMRRGEMDADGVQREWTDRIEIVEAGTKSEVSSTKARAAAQGGRWEELESLCPAAVADWIRQMGLYSESER